MNDIFGTHVRTEVEIGPVETAFFVQTPGSMDERDVCRALDAVSEETAEFRFGTKTCQTLVDWFAVGLLGRVHCALRPSGEGLGKVGQAVAIQQCEDGGNGTAACGGVEIVYAVDDLACADA